MIDLENEKMVLALWFSSGQKPSGITETMFFGSACRAVASLVAQGYHTPTQTQLEAQGASYTDYLDAIESNSGMDESGTIVRRFKSNYLRREKLEEVKALQARLVNPLDDVSDLISVDDDTDMYSQDTLVMAYDKDIPNQIHLLWQEEPCPRNRILQQSYYLCKQVQKGTYFWDQGKKDSHCFSANSLPIELAQRSWNLEWQHATVH